MINEFLKIRQPLFALDLRFKVPTKTTPEMKNNFVCVREGTKKSSYHKLPSSPRAPYPSLCRYSYLDLLLKQKNLDQDWIAGLGGYLDRKCGFSGYPNAVEYPANGYLAN